MLTYFTVARVQSGLLCVATTAGTSPESIHAVMPHGLLLGAILFRHNVLFCPADPIELYK